MEEPMKETMQKTVSFDVPVKVDCDVLVVGGGPAGIAAAIASARHNARTVLIEQYGCVGGMATVGLVGPFMTSYDTQGKEQIVKGIFEELVSRMVDEGGAIHPSEIDAGSDFVSFIVEAHHNATPFDPEVMKYVAMEMLLEAGVEVKLHTRLVNVLMQHTTIDYLVFADKAGLGLAKAQILIDATGDGDVAAAAGNPYEKGRKEDGRMQPATMFMRIGNVHDDVVIQWAKEHMKQPGDRLFQDIVSQARKEGKFPDNLPREAVGMYRQPRKGEWRINTSRILGIDGTDPDSLTKAEIEGRRQVQGLLEFFRNSCPGMEDIYLIDTATQVGIRESRRIIGKYTLTKDDVQQATRFDDAIARYSFYLDIHNPAGGGQETKKRLFIEGGPFFEIPYRCLVPSETDNLLIAGRCVSADHQAHGATRIMPACFATGQAAGTAAAQAIQAKCKPEDVDVTQLRDTLQQEGCVL
ncbi:FAD-dependent oxidoreductase [candidate division KSB3 bacterium]|uniref:FAD-dependent oxidoreductase n=1 Tax=candidate division KSB3 bacterium TaxID=2044937 RepID=A0A9D5JUJ2_9BACT|nr:FAD-dependent oxidoreductase [candidate division KSB3 bacterium]MBD3324393.1 FAD-dependent oxidoreductase [candidate division KSB3 bacterium]